MAVTRTRGPSPRAPAAGPAPKLPLVAWTPRKILYDAVALAFASAVAGGHLLAAGVAEAPFERLDVARAVGAAAFALLASALLIGPLARLAPRPFGALLFNRRHLGVMAFFLMAGHAALALSARGQAPLIEDFGRAGAAASAGAIDAVPFRLFGLAALAIFAGMAATSHDIWLRKLTPGAWKAIHMAGYCGFALVILHIAAGAVQTGKGAAVLLAATGLAGGLVGGAHLLSAFRRGAPRAPRVRRKAGERRSPWRDAGPADRIPLGGAAIVRLPRNREAAIFRTEEGYFALSNACAHQLGPLGEGRVCAGYVTCPWHGHEFNLKTGRAPAPYLDRVETFALRIEGGRLLIHPDQPSEETPT